METETNAQPLPPAASAVAEEQEAISDVEKAPLVKLREALPDIVKAAGEAATSPVSATLWGVPLQPTDASEQDDPRIDVILAKFLKARNNDLDQAREMLTNTLKWRAEFGVDALLDETFPEDVFGSVGYMHGTDKEGRPVTYNFYGNLDNKAVFGDLERFLRWRVQLHERGMRAVDFVNTSDMVQVHDYDGVGIFSYDKYARAASRATVQVMSDNYPETLATKVFANVPAWGETIFNIIGRWLSDDTKRKFVVVSATNAYAALADRIDPENIPEKFKPAATSASEEKPTEPAAATATAEDAATPPEPQPAHSDAADDLPAPTATSIQDEGKKDDAAAAAAAVDDVAAAQPQPAQVTAAPEEGGDAVSDKEPTAGMRPDENNTAENAASEEEAKSKDDAAGEKPSQ
ncbi:Non-classical phosphatidylinositol transfer protein (PITP) [Coemansia sp. RSA 2399]|nr:Non-classical phosphatidylinositol transfer protein (PITP) [Coemansia sp. RSA 2399]